MPAHLDFGRRREYDPVKAGAGRDITDVELLAGIASYKGSCTYNIDTRIMTVIFQLGIDAERGPAMSGRTTSLSILPCRPSTLKRTPSR